MQQNRYNEVHSRILIVVCNRNDHEPPNTTAIEFAGAVCCSSAGKGERR